MTVTVQLKQHASHFLIIPANGFSMQTLTTSTPDCSSMEVIESRYTNPTFIPPEEELKVGLYSKSSRLRTKRNADYRTKSTTLDTNTTENSNFEQHFSEIFPGLFTLQLARQFLYLDTSTFLVECWFSRVGEIYSAYDSPDNVDRKLAGSTWSNSEAVYFTLQTMSALYLKAAFPWVEAKAPRLEMHALMAIREALSSFYQARKQALTGVPLALLFASFALGTSMCWNKTTDLGLVLRENVAKVLNICNAHEPLLSLREKAYMVHFEKSLNYWDMLVSITPNRRSAELYRLWRIEKSILLANKQPPDVGLPCSGSNRMGRSESQARLEMLDRFPPLHPWAGVSTQAQSTLSIVLTLCREECTRRQEKPHKPNDPCDHMPKDDNLSLARALRDDLLHKTSTPPISTRKSRRAPKRLAVETKDARTSAWHLQYCAEAAYLVALLQLYLTFGGLDIRWPHEQRKTLDSLSDEDLEFCARGNGTEERERERKITTYALEVVSLLQTIPRDSGSKRIQLLLYICAASGLRSQASGGDLSSQNTILELARRKVVSRFQAYAIVLPAGPLKVALRFINEVWSVYDREQTSHIRTHWLDILSDKDEFLTLFG